MKLRPAAAAIALAAFGIAPAAALAQPAAPAGAASAAPAPAPVNPPAEAAPAAAGASQPEPKITRSTVEDDNVRIEELRVRGESRSIVVSQKKGELPNYEIVTGEGGRDPSQRTRDSAGQRVWRLLQF